MAYKVLPKVDMDDVPDWDRRERKWEDIVNMALNLEPGKTIPLLFDTHREAKRARNAVRDAVNLRVGKVVLRTRIVLNDDGTAILYMSKLHSR